ncbi:MAG: alpha-2-macroglobulin family protein [Pseudomonadota bacterium]
MAAFLRPALRVICVLAFVGGGGAGAALADGNLTVARITPSGEDVPAQRQLVIEFDRAVVPLGRMERKDNEIPIEISPKLACEWRWLNDRALACQLGDGENMTMSTHYQMTVNPGIVAQDGTTLAAPFHHDFITSRVALDRAEFNGWTGPETPTIMVTFNQPVRRDSLLRALQFVWTENGGGTQGVQVSEGPDYAKAPDDALVVVPREPGILGFFKRLWSYIPWFRSENTPAPQEWARRTWMIVPAAPLPADTSAELKMLPGLVSGLGSEQSIGERQIKSFATFAAFKFLGARCEDNQGNTIEITPDKKPEALCGPWKTVRLVFSSPVQLRQIKERVDISPELGKATPESDPFADANLDETGGYYEWGGRNKGDTYTGRFPIYLRSDRDYEVSLKPGDVKLVDVFGRPLEGGLSARWRMDNRPANFELPNPVSVLEKSIDSDIPLYVNNLTGREFTFSRLTEKGVQNGLSFKEQLDPIRNVQYALPFGVRGMLEGKSGAVLGRLTTEPATQKEAPLVFAQVTPFALHAKLGHFNSFVWVTDMVTGAPVSGVRVSLTSDGSLFSMLCQSKFDGTWVPALEQAFAMTDENGLASLPGRAPKAGQWESPCDTALTIKATKGDDVALLPLYYQFEADTYRASGETIWPNSASAQEHMRVWGTTAQGVYKAGDTIQYKIYVRGQGNEGLTPAPSSLYRVQLIDPTGKLVAETKDIPLNEFGATSGEFALSKNGAVGWYRFRILQKLFATAPDIDNYDVDEGAVGGDGWYAWKPMQVLVSDFTPASFRVTTSVNGTTFAPDQTADVEGKAALHSGGAYTNATARVTAMFDPQVMQSDHPVAASFDFSNFEASDTSQRMIAQLEQPLDNDGLAKVSVKIPDQPNQSYGKLTFEVAVADDRGKSIASSASATFASTDRFVGLKPTAWIFQAGKEAAYNYIVVDPAGAPAKGADVAIEILRKNVTAARVKSAGNVYQTVYNTTWDKAGTCKGTSTLEPQTCNFTPGEAGEYRLVAQVTGTTKKTHKATSDFWVTGRNVVLWDSEPDTALQIFPEQPKYKVGDTARYLIKNPYPNAKALVTIERYGVIDSFVKTFDSSTPILEFPVKPDYAPGFYVSIVLVSPRADKPLDENMVDLGKPAFRMGYIAVPVTDPFNEMMITAKSDKGEYRPGDKVRVDLHAAPRHKGEGKPIEFAVAVLDQAVFDLVTGGDAYFDPYRGFYRLDSLDVRNYNLLLNLVGRQKFEKKGANPGGDGGVDFKFRDVSKFVAFWNPSIIADAKGNASVDFEAPDNLTGWRVLALAVTPDETAGLGTADFKVNRPTEIRPVMPNQVLEGDDFSAGFSVMNRTDRPREVTVRIEAAGDIDGKDKVKSVEQKVKLEPFARSTVFLPMKAGLIAMRRDVPQGKIIYKVTAGDTVDKDGYLFTLPVGKGIDLVTAAEYGTTDKDNVTTPVAFPDAIRPDAGDISVTLSPTVITDVASAFRYIAYYPFYCWEQRLTKGVMAANFAALRSYLPDDLQWADAASTLKATLTSAADFQAPNGGMAYWVASNDRVDPYLSAYTALGFTWLEDRKTDVPEPVSERLNLYLEEFLRKDTAPDYYSAQMISSVRAVALAALARESRVTARDIERLRPDFKTMGLFGNAMVLQASLSLKDGTGDKIAKERVDFILAHSNQTSGKFSFAEDQGEGFARILATPLRDNCAILSSLVAYSKAGKRKDIFDVAYKLVRSISQSQRKEGYWGNTQENMFCANALADYAAAFEAVDPKVNLTVALGDALIGEAKIDGLKAKPVTVMHEIDAKDVGRKTTLDIKREGEGRIYYATRLSYAPTSGVTEAVNSGIDIRREYSVERDGKRVLLDDVASVKRGELVRVDIFVSLPAARNFVVVNDPVPGGLEPVNRDLATTSNVDADKATIEAPADSRIRTFSDWIEYASGYWSFYHQEMRDESVRFYSDYLGAGNYHLSYMAQAVATGEFAHRAVKAEEMYDPDVFGNGTAGRLTVTE